MQQAVIDEREQLQRIELPRFAQIEPVGRRPMSRSLSPIEIRVDGRRGAYIGFSGEARPCAMAAQATGAVLGNAIREGVVHVWQNDAYRRFRDRHASDAPPEICRACPVYLGRAQDAPQIAE